MRKSKAKIILLVIVIVLALIPFLWLKPGEMDLGGDSSRLYFYDPYNYFKYNILFAIVPSGFSIEQSLAFFAPFGILLIFLKKFIPSSYLLITLFNSFNLVVAFLSMFGIVNELLSKESKKRSVAVFLAAVFTGIYYIFSPIMVRSAWDKALITHEQIFLNPLIFYLLLRYIRTNKTLYLLTVLIVTVVFSVNFSWAAAPILFGFYPFAVIFLLLYGKITKLKYSNIPIFLSALLFIFLHAFHFVPLVLQILDKSGAAFARTFTSQNQYDVGLSYFVGIAPSIKLTDNLLALPQMVVNIIPIKIAFFFVPILLLCGLWLNGRKAWSAATRTGFLLLFSIFLLLVFLVTANITNTGFALYKSLFKIPGFSMFRNFYGQWQFSYLFFLSLLLGYSLFFTSAVIKKTIIQCIIFMILIVIVATSALPFVRGDMVNLVLNVGQKKEFKIPIKMDPEYEQVLNYIRSERVDAKYFSLPFTEAFHQQLAGTQQGMYQGPSTISILTGHSDFNGYQLIPPFSELLLKLVKEKKYNEIGKLLGLWNVRYVFYNSDENIMAYSPDFPYQHVKDFFPKNQTGYKNFVKSLPVKKKKDFGRKYHIYELSDAYYLPSVYIAKEIKYSKNKLDEWGNLTEPFFVDKKKDPRVVFTEENKYTKYEVSKTPKISFQKVNPTKYKVHIKNVTGPYVLILSHAFNSGWKLYIDPYNSGLEGKDMVYFNGDINEALHGHTFFDLSELSLLNQTPIAENKHFVANAFSNGWAINPSDVDNKKGYTLIIEMTSQRYIYFSLLLSIGAFAILLGWIGFIVAKVIKNIIK